MTNSDVMNGATLALGVTMEQENVFLDDINGVVDVNPDEVDAIQTPAKNKS